MGNIHQVILASHYKHPDSRIMTAMFDRVMSHAIPEISLVTRKFDEAMATYLITPAPDNLRERLHFPS